MIKLEDVKKIYKMGTDKFYALDGVSLEINKGEFVSIQGASGSGKTTLLNIMGCLDNFEEGSYYLDDVDIRRLNDSKKSKIRNKKIGFVFQDFALINSKSVLFNIMLPLLFSDVPFRKIKKLAAIAAEKVGIKDQVHKKANQLSGGQRQRVAIARAIVNDPEIILADEPTGALDSKTSEQIMLLLKQLNESGITVIVVTHDDKVAGYCGRHLFISDGKLV